MKQFLYIFLLAVVAGCGDNQASVEGETGTTVNKEKTGEDGSSSKVEPGVNDVDVDTIGMAEFLALKESVAAKYRQGKNITDEDDEGVDTTGFTAFKKSKAKTSGKPCDCEDSIKADRKNNSGNARAIRKEKTTQQSESSDEEESSDETEAAEDSTRLSGVQQMQ